MASWSVANITSWTGKVVTATEWNNYFGSGGSIVYLKESYSKYYTSFYTLRSVATNTETVMTSFRIPASWNTGLYFIEYNTFVNAVQEPSVDVRRQATIYVNNSLTRVNTYLSIASSFTFKPIYNVSTYRRMNVTDLVEFRFFQASTVTSFITYGTVQKVGP